MIGKFFCFFSGALELLELQKETGAIRITDDYYSVISTRSWLKENCIYNC